MKEDYKNLKTKKMDKETKIILWVTGISLIGFWLLKNYGQKRTAPCPEGKKLVDSVCHTNPYRVINTTSGTIGGDVTGKTFNAGEIVDVVREDTISSGRTNDVTPVAIVIVDNGEQAIPLVNVVKL
jgi:hypothetical protein